MSPNMAMPRGTRPDRYIRSAPIERTISRFAEAETLDGRHTHAGYGASENGGYLSVTSTNA